MLVMSCFNIIIASYVISNSYLYINENFDNSKGKKKRNKQKKKIQDDFSTILKHNVVVGLLFGSSCTNCNVQSKSLGDVYLPKEPLLSRKGKKTKHRFANENEFQC